MKAKLLKQIRKRFDIKLVSQKYNFVHGHEFLFKDKKTGKYYSVDGFGNFIDFISELMNRYYEFLNYQIKRSNRIHQRKLKKEFEKTKINEPIH